MMRSNMYFNLNLHDFCLCVIVCTNFAVLLDVDILCVLLFEDALPMSI